MRRSRKGWKLNDAQYFRQPLPHPRRKTARTLLLSRLSVIRADNNLSLNDPSAKVRNPWRAWDTKRLDARQSSLEMAHLADQGHPEEDLRSSRGVDPVPIIPVDHPGRSSIAVPDDTAGAEGEKVLDDPGTKGDDPGTKGDDPERKGDDRGGTWWTENRFGRMIRKFFERILRRERKGRRNGDRRPCFVREKEEEGEEEGEEKGSEEERISTLVRQIERTRDRNLRINLLKKELHARLPEKNLFDDSLPLRQLSSPLC